MKKILRRALGLTLSVALASSTFAQGTAFTYQGRLDSGGTPYTGSAEFQATLWNVASAGTALASNTPVQVVLGVTNGLFVLPLDFGASFPGAERWLQLEVRTTIGAFTVLTPRQPLTATPYAVTAGNLTGPVPAGQLSGAVPSANLVGTYSGALTLNNAANSLSGSGAGLTALNASQLTSGTVPDVRLAANVARTNQVWLLGGNAGTTPGTHSVGTTDNQPLEFKVNDQRVLRIEPAMNSFYGYSPNLLGGHSGNIISNGFVGAVIAGGGAEANPNRVEADFGTVSGGRRNTIESNATEATIGGGGQNMIQNATGTTISGGKFNTIQDGATLATICGGFSHIIHTNASFATISGGQYNTVQTTARYSTISGGHLNTIQSLAHFATIGGGSGNVIRPDANYATIPGGRLNSATNHAFAAGFRAKADHTGAFVWADFQHADFASLRANQFRVRADGGARFDFNEDHWVDLRYQSNFIVAARIINTSSGAYLSAGGSWVNSSDRDRKTGFTRVDPQAVLAKVAALPLSEWSYKTEGETTRHLGPVAQDFHAAFGLGGDSKAIATVDADGVALAAIQGLNHKVEMGKQKAESLEQRLAQKETEITELQQRLEKLEASLAVKLIGGVK
jgi:trimeric autotransporter adhesin